MDVQSQMKIRGQGLRLNWELGIFVVINIKRDKGHDESRLDRLQ